MNYPYCSNTNNVDNWYHDQCDYIITGNIAEHNWYYEALNKIHTEALSCKKCNTPPDVLPKYRFVTKNIVADGTTAYAET